MCSVQYITLYHTCMCNVQYIILYHYMYSVQYIIMYVCVAYSTSSYIIHVCVAYSTSPYIIHVCMCSVHHPTLYSIHSDMCVGLLQMTCLPLDSEEYFTMYFDVDCNDCLHGSGQVSIVYCNCISNNTECTVHCTL